MRKEHSNEFLRQHLVNVFFVSGKHLGVIQLKYTINFSRCLYPYCNYSRLMAGTPLYVHLRWVSHLMGFLRQTEWVTILQKTSPVEDHG